jgi:hypothetical protein
MSYQPWGRGRAGSILRRGVCTRLQGRKLETGDFTTFTMLTEPRGLYVEADYRGFGESGPFVA